LLGNVPQVLITKINKYERITRIIRFS